MSKTITATKCQTCGQSVSIEDGQRTSLCDCDPFCACCRKQFIGQKPLCPDCLEGEQHGDFQAQFPHLHDQVFARRQAYELPEKIEKDLLDALNEDLREQWRLS